MWKKYSKELYAKWMPNMLLLDYSYIKIPVSPPDLTSYQFASTSNQSEFKYAL